MAKAIAHHYGTINQAKANIKVGREAAYDKGESVKRIRPGIKFYLYLWHVYKAGLQKPCV